MNQNIIEKIFQNIVIINIIIIIILSAYSTFLKNSNKIINFISSPIYLGAWITLILLIFSFPLFIKKETNGYINYFFIHLPFVLFVFVIIINILTSRSYEVSVQENEKINISSIANNLGIDYAGTDASLKLSKIKLTNGKNKNISSFIDIKDNSVNSKKIVSINKPIKIGKIKFFQKNWVLGITEIDYTFENNEYNFFEQQNSPIITKQGNYFEIYPKDIYNNKILYAWKIYSKDNKILNFGQFINYEDPVSVFPPKEFKFSILKEDYKLISILQATYKPFNLILGLYSIIFLIFLFYIFWGKNLIQNILYNKLKKSTY